MSAHTVLDSSLVTEKFQTRAERRRLEKEAIKGKATYNVTKEELHAYREECRKEFIEKERQFVDNIIFNSFVISLNKHYNFGEKRLTTLLTEVNEQIDCLKLGYLSKDDLRKLSESLQGKVDKIK